MDYDKRYGKYRIKLTLNDLKKHRDFFKDLVRKSKGIVVAKRNQRRRIKAGIQVAYPASPEYFRD